MATFELLNQGYFIVTRIGPEIESGVFLHGGAQFSCAGVEIIHAIQSGSVDDFIKQQKSRRRKSEKERCGFYDCVEPAECSLSSFIALKGESSDQVYPNFVYRYAVSQNTLAVYVHGDLYLKFPVDDLNRLLAAFERWDELCYALSIDETTLETNPKEGEKQLRLLIQNGASEEFIRGLLHCVPPVSLIGTKYDYTRHYSGGGKLQNHGEWQLSVLGPGIDDQFQLDMDHLVEYNSTHIQFDGLQTKGPYYGRFQFGPFLSRPIQAEVFSSTSMPAPVQSEFQTLPLLYGAVSSYLRENQERMMWLTVCTSIVLAAEGIAKGAAESDSSDAKENARYTLDRAKHVLADIGFEHLSEDGDFVMSFLRLVDDAKAVYHI